MSNVRNCRERDEKKEARRRKRVIKEILNIILYYIILYSITYKLHSAKSTTYSIFEWKSGLFARITS